MKPFITLPKLTSGKLLHAFSTRALGSMSLRGSSKNELFESWEKFAAAAGFDLKRTVFLRVVHGTGIKVVKRVYNKASPSMLEGYDAAITNKPGVFLLLPSADCHPFIFYDPKNRVTGLAHVGWRGAVESLPVKVLRRMEKEFGSDKKDVVVAVGPGICSNCNLQPSPLAQEDMSGWGAYLEPNGEKTRARNLDFAVDSLIAYGLLRKNIILSGICTKENWSTFFSHEAAQERGNPQQEGRFATVVGLQ